ncbi:NDR1/HIN1-like protein 10 [Oryza brachyantha]|uniref:NDR1/HIN1-like protein 10 n=1 Tax=Oryza brachyantha TaxID=4533 RepID=UPI001AD99296|nr:NDR1/HIN1-like protein 10 [Oryza brachyantha]
MAGRSRGIGDTGHATRVAVVRCIVVAIIATIVLAGLVALVFWLVVRPKPIEYIITRAVVRHFNVTPPGAGSAGGGGGGTVNATFYLILAVDNPNRRVSMRYDRVELRVLYGENGTQLATAELPAFHQPRRNETLLQARAVARSTPVPDQAARELEHDLAAGELVSVEVRVVADVRFIVSGVISRYYRVRGTCSPVNIGLSPSAARSFESVPCDVEIW